ncbi:MAG: VOC family protein [Actinomycetota bacterium]|nr:VOC family protein [Actinomycetota bacterium]
MPQNPPEGYPRICPYLYYEDAAAAIDWLTNAFGFTERMRMPGPDRGIAHAEIALDDGIVMLASPPDFKQPGELNTHSVHVYVDNVDKHFEQATTAGAKVVREPEDQFYGDRIYGVEDLEGHHWYFSQHVKDVSPEEMEAAMTASA